MAKGVDLAIVMGKPKGEGPMGKPMAKDQEKGEPDGDEGDELPAGFEEAFSEAFPEAAGDKDRMLALKRLIEACSY
jgi:hypothetical protein